MGRRRQPWWATRRGCRALRASVAQKMIFVGFGGWEKRRVSPSGRGCVVAGVVLAGRLRGWSGFDAVVHVGPQNLHGFLSDEPFELFLLAYFMFLITAFCTLRELTSYPKRALEELYAKRKARVMWGGRLELRAKQTVEIAIKSLNSGLCGHCPPNLMVWRRLPPYLPGRPCRGCRTGRFPWLSHGLLPRGEHHDREENDC